MGFRPIARLSPLPVLVWYVPFLAPIVGPVTDFCEFQITHLIFKRFEPTNVPLLLLLLVALPILLTYPLSAHFTLSLGSVLAFIIFHASLLTSIILYRLSPFHPLARYPGPVACKISMFWMTWVTRIGKRHVYLKTLHERYGDIVRIGQYCFKSAWAIRCLSYSQTPLGPNEVSIRDASVVNSLMGTTGLPKGPSTFACPHWRVPSLTPGLAL